MCNLILKNVGIIHFDSLLSVVKTLDSLLSIALAKDSDPSDHQFEPTLSWLNQLMKVYQNNDNELDIIEM